MATAQADESRPIRRKPFVPDGIAFHRRMIRRKGNLVAMILMLATTLLGLIWSNTVDGAIGGLGGFAILTLAIPFLPIFGAPTSGSTVKYVLAFVLSFGLWTGLGIFATRRTLGRPIATWREWIFAFVPLALAVIAGVGVGLLITAISVL